MAFNYWILIAVDVDRPIGGVKQLYRFAEALSACGANVSIVQGTDSFRPTWFDFSTSLKFISSKIFFKKSFSSTTDFLVLPETFIPHLSQLPSIPKIIFNQNASYSFGEKRNIRPSYVINAYSDPSVIAVICISIYDYNFISECLGFCIDRLFLLPNPIETELFYPVFPKKRKIVFMPRKNREHSRILLAMIESSKLSNLSSWDIQPLDKMTVSEVATHMREAYLFLSFGYPEGFGLPVAEALASGCIVVGYHGLGGDELFKLASPFNAAFPVDYLDFVTFSKVVISTLNSFDNSSPVFDSNYNLPSLIRDRYSSARFVDSVCYLDTKLAALI